MRYRSSSNCAGFVYINELKSVAVHMGQCKTLVNGNKLGFQTFTRLDTYSKAEQVEVNHNRR